MIFLPEKTHAAVIHVARWDAIRATVMVVALATVAVVAARIAGDGGYPDMPAAGWWLLAGAIAMHLCDVTRDAMAAWMFFRRIRRCPTCRTVEIAAGIAVDRFEYEWADEIHVGHRPGPWGAR